VDYDRSHFAPRRCSCPGSAQAECGDFLEVYRRHRTSGVRFEHVAILSPHLAAQFVQALQADEAAVAAAARGTAREAAAPMLLHLLWNHKGSHTDVLASVSEMLGLQQGRWQKEGWGCIPQAFVKSGPDPTGGLSGLRIRFVRWFSMDMEGANCEF
jgi:hypothetical protein